MARITGLCGRYAAPWIAAAVVCMACAAAGASNADLVPVRIKIKDYHTEKAAADAATGQNRADEAMEHMTKARAALREAVILCEQAGAQTSSDLEVLTQYAEALQLNGDYDLAAETLQRALKSSPNAAVLWMKLGENQMNIGPAWREKAFVSLKKAIDLDGASPEAAQAWSLLGDLYWHEALPDIAREHYAQAQKLAPEEVWAKIALAALDIREGRVLEGSKAIDDLGKKAQSYDVETRERLREALTSFSNTRRSFQDTAENHAAYARLLYRAARFPEAVLALQRATQLNPADTATWNFAASLYAQLGNLSKAKDACQKSLEADPNQPDTRDMLNKIEAESKKAAVPETPLIMRPDAK